MTTQRYQYTDNQQTHSNDNSGSKLGTNGVNAPTKVSLNCEQSAGHGDHWDILTNDVATDVPNWLQQAIETAVMPRGLFANQSMPSRQEQDNLLIASNELCHINQVLAMADGKPKSLVNAYPCVNSPYGVTAKIERVIACDDQQEAILRLVTADGTVIYAFDQFYALNASQYEADKSYYVNLSAWAYGIEPSNDEEVIRIEDQDAIRYHRAFNDIVAKNGGTPPDDLDAQIEAWQPDNPDEPLLPVEINLGHMCAYLFGETLGQEDEAWCQGQVLGKQETEFFGQTMSVFDVAILREPDVSPLVVRMATPADDAHANIEVNDYIQANIWLQGAIYEENQNG